MQLLPTYRKRWFIIHRVAAPISDTPSYQITLVFVLIAYTGVTLQYVAVNLVAYEICTDGIWHRLGYSRPTQGKPVRVRAMNVW